MYNVLLADDERTIREGLKTLIPWEQFGFTVIDTAADGQEALHKCLQLRPHLIISDIRMPGMTGLELIHNIRLNNLNCRVLILSGYADFEYAKQAISQRIDGYLLKPVDEEELVEYLHNLKGELDLQTTNLHEKQQIRETAFDNALLSLLSGEAKLLSIPVELENLLSWNGYETILIEVETQEHLTAPQLGRFKQKLTEQMVKKDDGVTFSIEGYVGILVRDGLNQDNRKQRITNAIEEVSSEFSVQFIAVSGGKVDSWQEIRHSYQTAYQRIKQSFFLESGAISYPVTCLTDQQSITNVDQYMSTLKDTLFLYLEIGNTTIIQQLLQEAIQQMIADGITENVLKSQFVHLFSALLDKCGDRLEHEPTVALRAELSELYKETRYIGFLKRLAPLVGSIAQPFDNLNTETVIKRMIDLIHRRYAENLKLEKLSEIFNYSAVYLGKLFKQETGEQFNTYLDKVRIEKAKALLETDIKVYRIAEQVGYSNVDYFHLKFRKYVGISPSAYRRKYIDCDQN